MKTYLTILTILLIIGVNFGQAKISISDFKMLNNTSWEGKLTYKNYSDSKLVSIPTTMQIQVADNALVQKLQYTYEPEENITSKTKIKKKGAYLGKQKVIEKIANKDGILKIVTMAKGKDANKEATLYFTYEITSNTFKTIKEVQFDGTNERIVRNTYSYTKIN
ncbi:hypothetical protein SAMN05421824_1643 [Hyunsoonleella jejuensis]|uniref:Uncharacterized protein n=1 Tax=Hyunsoonleella jejuensis TaxID=419940 RepID=A0A1H9G0W3_9FLAO|nr:hypothetical protein [Hyunsoonleella jejuensis]SEQ43795.1 hypothetical protein SAMN05421824_1643 [Hyunsoonleella jejuensis]